MVMSFTDQPNKLEQEVTVGHAFEATFEFDELPTPSDLVHMQTLPLLDSSEDQTRYKRFARPLDMFSHGLTELKETALSYRSVTHGLVAAYIVLHAVADQEGMPTSKYILMEIRPQVREKGKRIAYAMRRIQRQKQNGNLVGSEAPDAEIEVGDAFGREGDVLKFSVGENPRIKNATIQHPVTEIIGVYSTFPSDIAQVA